MQNATEPIKLWEKIEIYVGEGADAGRYIARIEDFERNGLVISSPEYITGGTLMRDGSDCTVLLTRRDAVYEFHSRITTSGQGEDRRYFLTPPGNIRRVQRRQFVRIELVKPFAFALLPERVSDDMAFSSLKWNQTKSINVSGGGMLIAAPVPISTGDLLLLKMKFFAEVGLPLALGAICRRTETVKGDLRAGIEFVRAEHINKFFNEGQRRLLPESAAYFDQTMQNKLVNYVFQEQVRLRQKGLL